ncbi:neurite extension and migration factor [Engraulis encrasicolus]|uniref:neurite extension and migration factor n=1 Tax=Engraulis encrasicolus TaxID=184585 RepID=UPI002FD27EDE
MAIRLLEIRLPPSPAALSSSACCPPRTLDVPDETTAPPAAALSSLSSLSLLSPLSSSFSSSSLSSLSSLSSASCDTPLTPWHQGCAADKAVPAFAMELCSGGGAGSGGYGAGAAAVGGVEGGCSSEATGGGGDHLSSHSHTESTTAAAPADTCESVLGLAPSDFPIPTSTIQCLSSSPMVVEQHQQQQQQILSDQLLSSSSVSASMAEVEVVAAREEVTVHGGVRNGRGGELDGDSADADADAAAVAVAVTGEDSIMYEGLVVGGEGVEEGEEAQDQDQDWSCLESLISESRMELLDLCSRSELAVNLFCEEDVENYMFQEEDVVPTVTAAAAAACLAGDVCSLKIRYEPFPDGVERNGQEAVQQHLDFFPTGRLNEKPESWGTEDMEQGGTEDVSTNTILSTATPPLISPASQSLFDFSSSPGDSVEFSDDDNSSCTGSSPDTWLTGGRRGAGHGEGHGGHLSRENSSSSSSQLSYRLRAKRKVAFREDYLYDVDSIEEQREKNAKVKVGQKGEKDDDWCPKKKQRKSHSRKDPPVVIKYIIINRFKGVKHMTVKLGRVDVDGASSVCLSEGSLTQYEKLAPLKAFWESHAEEQMGALGGTTTETKHLNGCKVSPGSALKKRRQRITKRLRIQRIHTVEKPPTADNNNNNSNAQEVVSACQVVASKPETSTDSMTAASEAGTLLSDRPVGQGGPRRRAMKQESEDGKPIRVRKFRSEARLRASKLAEAQARLSMGEETAAKEEEELGGVCGMPCGSSTSSSSPQAASNGITSSSSNGAPDKCTFTLNPQGGAASASASASANVAPLPGGYLQTLLEATDSSGTACTSYFPLAQQQQPQQTQLQPQQTQTFLLGVPPFLPPQSCVLSPPSESELPQSPNSYSAENKQAQAYTADITTTTTTAAAAHHTDISYAAVWPSQPGETAAQLPFPAATIPSHQSPLMLPSAFPKQQQTLMIADQKATATVCYHAMPPGGDTPSEESLDTEHHQHQHQHHHQQQLLDLDYRLSPGGVQCQGHRQGDGGEGDGVGRLVSFDSLGSLSVASSNYSSMSLHGEGTEGGGGGGEGGDGGEEGEMSDNFLSHCSPQLVLQQSLEEVTPLRESSADLLDISNFTPDKFRHTSSASLLSLSDMSPPDTPSPSPHRLIRQGGGGGGFASEAAGGGCEAGGGHWECGVISSEVEDANGGSRHTHLLQIHSFGPDEDEDDNSKDEDFCLKGHKGLKRKGGAKSGPKKTKSAKAAKQGEQHQQQGAKSSRQESKSVRKIKAILEGKTNKGGGGGGGAMGSQSPSAAMVGGLVAGDWPGLGGLSDDDQQEFKEPSNILSNIVSGMAEVQRFMQASVEPLWGPAASSCCPLPGEQQALQSQTLRILGGPFEPAVGKKRGGANSGGAGRGKKGAGAAGAGAKNPPKLIPADFFPALGLDCFPVPHRPAHKKMYRHKSSAKFAREGLALGKGNAKVSALTATLEKQR